MGFVVSAIGAYQKGQAEGAAADYQSQVALNNAAIARSNAAMSDAAGAAKETAQGMRTAQAVGTGRASFGAGGIDANTGSAATVQQAIGKVGALDALTIRSNTAREVYGYQVKEASELAEAQLDKFKGEQARTGGDISALGTFLTGASSVGGSFAKWSLGAG